MANTVTTEQTFYEHVKELRKRITWAALAFLAGGLVGYIYRKPALEFLRAPINTTLYYNTPSGGLNLVMEVAAICGLLIAIPVLAYQLVRFLAPAWGDSIRAHHVFIITGISAILAFSGAAFGYYIMLPLSLHFFGEFAIAGVHPLISANYYLDFVIKCILTFIVIFQIPLIMLFINKIKPLPPRKMLKWEKYVIVGALLLAVILPFTYDPVSQFILAVPIILLYNLALVMIVWTNHWDKRKVRKATKKQAKKPAPAPEVVHPKPIERPRPAPQPIAAPLAASARAVPLAPLTDQPASITKHKPIASPKTRSTTSPPTRRMVDITLPRSHANTKNKSKSNHLDLRGVIPQPRNTPSQTLDLDMSQ